MSLRLRAVLIAGVALIVLWAAAAGWMMRGVRASLDDALDERLAMSATMVSALMARAAFTPHTEDQNWRDAIRAGSSDGIACEIRSLQGTVLAHTDDGPQSSNLSLPTGFSTREIDGREWRIYVLQDAGGYQVMTADLVARRDVLTNGMLRSAGLPFLIAVVGGLLALWIGIGRGLKPLETLRKALRHKRADDTTPIDIGDASTELRPVVAALNGWMDRQARTLAAQRAFTDGAAHELRTPLTAIDTQLQVAELTQTNMVESAEGSAARSAAALALQRSREGVRHLCHTLDQLMALARTEAPVHAQDHCASVLRVVGDVLSEGDMSERVTFRMACADRGAAMPHSMLSTALRNLVDNAVRYSPTQHKVTVLVRDDETPHGYCIEVADRGPGLTDAQTAQLGQRFWRGDRGRQRGEGAGLGISIVQAIATRFEATLTFAPRDGGGLLACLRVPVALIPMSEARVSRAPEPPLHARAGEVQISRGRIRSTSSPPKRGSV